MVCLDKKNEGLVVPIILEFNLSLLRKWFWRVHVEHDSLWYKMLVAKYRVARGRVKKGGRLRSAWGGGRERWLPEGGLSNI